LDILTVIETTLQPTEKPKISTENTILTGKVYRQYPPKKKRQPQPQPTQPPQTQHHQQQQSEADDRQALALLGLPLGNFAVSHSYGCVIAQQVT
jgi:hypothetical protein